MPAYTRFSYRSPSWAEPHEVDRGTLAILASRIVAAEGPIHVEEVARRIAASYGKEKAGSRILDAAREALRRAQRGDSDLLTDAGFWFTRAQQADPPVRDRSAESGPVLKAANISLIEIEAALRIARDDCGDGDDPDLIRTAARLLGFRRVGSDLQARLSEGLRRVRLASSVPALLHPRLSPC